MKLHKEASWVVCVALIVLLVANIFIQAKIKGPVVMFNAPVPDAGGDNLPQHSYVARRLNANPQDNAQEAAINIELWGTILGNPSMAFLFNPETGQQGLFRANDNFSGYRLVKISAGKVVLERGGWLGTDSEGQ